jgi:hypothetical protein
MNLQCHEKVWDEKPCLNPQHGPPSHMVFPGGWNVHTCPSCGTVSRFWVTRPTW